MSVDNYSAGFRDGEKLMIDVLLGKNENWVVDLGRSDKLESFYCSTGVLATVKGRCVLHLR